jgi:hypothetical protein
MPYDLRQSLARARERLEPGAGKHPGSERATRSDAGASRMPPDLQLELDRLFSGAERPRMRDVRAQLAVYCARRGLRPPSRAAIYAWLPRAAVPSYRIGELPAHVRELIHNLDDAAEIPGPQLVCVLMNHGDTRALSFAAGMPWLCLVRAERLRDFRPKSHALLRAVLRGRGLSGRST